MNMRGDRALFSKRYNREYSRTSSVSLSGAFFVGVIGIEVFRICFFLGFIPLSQSARFPEKRHVLSSDVRIACPEIVCIAKPLKVSAPALPVGSNEALLR